MQKKEKSNPQKNAKIHINPVEKNGEKKKAKKNPNYAKKK